MSWKFLLIIFIISFGANSYAENYNDVHQYKLWDHVLSAQHLMVGSKEVTLSDLQQINEEINNKITYREGQTWRTPIEVKKSGYGNCAEIATAKFYQIAKLGKIPKDMLVVIGVYTFPTGYQELHAVLQVKINGEIKVLDNKHGLSDDSQLFDASKYYRTRMKTVLYAVNDSYGTKEPLE